VGDGDADPNTDRHTPHDLGEALDAFQADTVLVEAMGADLARAFLTIRRDELARYEATGAEWSLDTITDWELAEYLPFY
jgi:glutamine synthetase